MIKARLCGYSSVTNRLSDVSYVVTGASGLTVGSRPISEAAWLLVLDTSKPLSRTPEHTPFKTAQALSGTVISLLTPFAHCVHTLTTDNGKEFAQHERIATALNADFYFAHPYASWQRGTNENRNALIRQFCPKKMHFDCITVPDIELAMNRLNHRPRKCLGFSNAN